MKRSLAFVIIIGLLLTLSIPTPLAAQDTVYYPTTEWRTSTPEEQGMDLAALADFVERVPKLGGVDSLMVVRNGYVVAEAYWHPFAQGMKHELMSASKSVISALVGIAIDKGYIQNVDQKVLDFFPEIEVVNLDENKQAMTIRDLLTMTSGFACELYNPGTDPVHDLVTRSDATAFGLGWRMADAPGTTWRYCQINVYLLSAILARTTGMDPLEFARQYLFTPLGITDVDWNRSAEGLPLGFAGLLLNTEDMAKIGYLFLNNGRWGDAQIVPADWVAASTEAHTANPYGIPNIGYGYLWWTYDNDSGGVGHFYNALGMYCQKIEVSAEPDLVVVFTGTDQSLGSADVSTPVFMQAILKAVKSDDPLPADPEGVARLDAAVQAAANPEAQPIPAMPALASEVSGETFQLAASDLLLREADVNRLPAEDWQIATLGLDFGQSDATLRLQTVSSIALSIPVGLDGVYRVVTTPFGTMAAEGQWQDDTRFNLYVRRLEQGPVLRYALTFSDDGFTGVATSARRGDMELTFPITMRFSGELVNQP